MSYHSYTNVLEYIPKKYVGLSSKQQQDRQAVYSFKEGNCPAYAKEQLVNKIKGIIGSDPSAWVVCFIPASTKCKHHRRYYDLSIYLNNNLACPVCIDGIGVAYDRESGHMTGKTGNPTENMVFNPARFAGKKVVLVDDVRTRGVTFDRTADMLESLGAVTVYGVFLAQTVHPNLPIGISTRYKGGCYNDDLNCILDDERQQQEIFNDVMEEFQYQQQMEIDFLYEIGVYN